GGNDAAIVLPDVDVDAAAQGVFNSAFIMSGQACAAIKRLYVHRDVHEPIVARLVELAEAAKVGDPFDPETTMGPLMTGEQFAKISDLVDDVRAVGGRIVTG